MPWISTDDRLPPLDVRVMVAGDFIPMDRYGQFTHGCGYASRRHYAGMDDWFWASEHWRATVGVRWWFDEE